MTAALEGGEWSAARPGRTLPQGETRYPFYRRLGGPQVRSGQTENLVPTGIRSRTAQPVVSRYTDGATRPIYICLCVYIGTVAHIQCNGQLSNIPISSVINKYYILTYKLLLLITSLDQKCRHNF